MESIILKKKHILITIIVYLYYYDLAFHCFVLLVLLEPPLLICSTNCLFESSISVILITFFVTVAVIAACLTNNSLLLQVEWGLFPMLIILLPLLVALANFILFMHCFSHIMDCSVYFSIFSPLSQGHCCTKLDSFLLPAMMMFPVFSSTFVAICKHLAWCSFRLSGSPSWVFSIVAFVVLL